MDLGGLLLRYQRTLLITVMMFKLGKTQVQEQHVAARVWPDLAVISLMSLNVLQQTSEGRCCLKERASPQASEASAPHVFVDPHRAPGDPFFP